MSLGDFDTSAVIYSKFTTYRPSTGAPFTLAGTPALSVYKDNSTTQSTTGVTLTVDFDSVTGLHHFAIDTSVDGAFYTAGSFFDVVVTTGTVDSISAVGTVVGRFTLRKNSALKPTTAGRTLDVSAGGEAGLDWANIGSPTTAVNLSATNIDTDQVIASVSGAVGSVTGLTAANLDVAVSTLATAANLATVAGYIDTEVASIKTVTDRLDTSIELDGAVYRFTANALEQAPTGGGGGGLDAAGVRAAIGLATANLDTQLADLPTTAELTTALGTSDDAILAVLGSPAGASMSADVAAIKSETSGIQSDTNDLQTRLPAALVGGRIDANMGAISGSATAADNLEDGAKALVVGTCSTGSTTTSVVTNLSEATDDHYNGRVITFVTGALAGQSTSISDYVGSTKTLTVVALTEAPANTDGFVIS